MIQLPTAPVYEVRFVPYNGRFIDLPSTAAKNRQLFDLICLAISFGYFPGYFIDSKNRVSQRVA